MDEATVTRQYTELVSAVQAMNATLDAMASFCRTYRLPIHTDHTIPERLSVECLSGSTSRTAAMAAYAQFTFDEDQDARTAFRHPGVVLGSTDELLGEVAAINVMKSDLKDAIAELEKDKHKRSSLCNRLFPKVAMSQVYRQIVVLDEEIKAVRFTWMRRTVGTKRMTRDDALQHIDENLAKEAAAGLDARVQALVMVRDRLSSMAADSVVYSRRQVPPHPRANVVYRNGTTKMVHANLPFIVRGQKSNIDIGDLREFDVSVRRLQRSDNKKLVCLHEGLQIYADHQSVDA